MSNRKQRLCDNCGFDIGKPPAPTVFVSHKPQINFYLTFCSFACLKEAVNNPKNERVREFERQADHPYDKEGK